MRDVILGILELFKSGGYGALSVAFLFGFIIVFWLISQISRQLKANWSIIDNLKKGFNDHEVKFGKHDENIECFKDNFKEIATDIKELLSRR